MSERDDEVFLPLTGLVKLSRGGTARLKQGDSFPKGAAKGELERLRGLGAMGAPPTVDPPTPTPDQAQAFADDEAKEIAKSAELSADRADRVRGEGPATPGAGETGRADGAATGGAAEQAREELVDEQIEESESMSKAAAAKAAREAGEDPGVDPEADFEAAKAEAEAGDDEPTAEVVAPNADATNEEVDAFVAAATVPQIVEAATSPELAQAFLESEEHLRKEEGGPRKTLVEGLAEKGATPAPEAEPSGD